MLWYDLCNFLIIYFFVNQLELSLVRCHIFFLIHKHIM